MPFNALAASRSELTVRHSVTAEAVIAAPTAAKPLYTTAVFFSGDRSWKNLVASRTAEAKPRTAGFNASNASLKKPSTWCAVASICAA